MNKKNNLKSSGFTLFETLVSTIIFGILMILLFSMSSEFFKLFTTSEARQTVNSKFIKAYNQIQREFIISNANSSYSYKTELINTKTRWFLFPTPIDDDGTVVNEGNSFSWQKIHIYYLTCPNSNCPECKDKINTADEDVLKTWEEQKYHFCSDKQLIRLIYEYSGIDDPFNFASILSLLSNDIATYTLNFDNNFPPKTEYQVETTEEKATIKYLSKKIIAADIFDMDVTIKQHNINIKLSTVRKEEIKKKLVYGKTDFTKEPGAKFVDEMEFTINTKN